jgi:hypothetical protein
MPEAKKSSLALALALFGWVIAAGVVVYAFSSYRFAEAFLADEPLQVIDRLDADDLQHPPPPHRSFDQDIETRDTLSRDHVRPPARTEVENPTGRALFRLKILRLTPPTGPPRHAAL